MNSSLLKIANLSKLNQFEWITCVDSVLHYGFSFLTSFAFMEQGRP